MLFKGINLVVRIFVIILSLHTLSIVWTNYSDGKMASVQTPEPNLIKFILMKFAFTIKKKRRRRAVLIPMWF